MVYLLLPRQHQSCAPRPRRHDAKYILRDEGTPNNALHSLLLYYDKTVSFNVVDMRRASPSRLSHGLVQRRMATITSHDSLSLSSCFGTIERHWETLERFCHTCILLLLSLMSPCNLRTERANDMCESKWVLLQLYDPLCFWSARKLQRGTRFCGKAVFWLSHELTKSIPSHNTTIQCASSCSPPSYRLSVGD